MAKLILRTQEGLEEEFSLDSGPVTIGRSPDCEISIDDNQASRQHCAVRRGKSGGWEVEDLGSTNGTLLNSVLVKKHYLKHGDVIRIGENEITLDDPEASGTIDEGGAGFSALVYARGDKKGEKIELTEQRTTIGRKEKNTITLQDGNASSYHCEIVRGLNGYTIRDLGSTNGTLVNNEMITEVPLQHGARIRIGSTRFVFQDPEMAEIDLELAGVDDDEADWGMMRELDLAAVRKRNPATVLFAVLFLAVLGGLFYLVQLESGPTKGIPIPRESLLENTYSFERPGEAFQWDSDPRGAVEPRITTKVHGLGTQALELRASEAADVIHEASIPAKDQRFTIAAKLGSRGAAARLGLQWTGLGLSRLEFGDPVTGGLQSVSLTGSAPAWATRVRAVVRIDDAATAHVDDITLVREGSAKADVLEQDPFVIAITDGDDFGMAHSRAPILVNGVLLSDGTRTKEAKVSAKAIDKIHVLVTIEGPGSTLGLRVEEWRGYLTRGGFRNFGTKENGTETYFNGSFPEEGSRTDERVRKLLVGKRGRAFAVLPATDDALLTSEARHDGRRKLWTISGPAKDGKFSFRIKTDLSGETAEAQDRMGNATRLYREGRWGEFIVEAPQVLAEFPFGNKARQRELNELIVEVTKEYVDLLKEANEKLADYKEFRDLQSLDRVREILEIFREKFQVKAGEGNRGKEYAEIASQEEAARLKALRKSQTKRGKGFYEQAFYVHKDQGELYSAAVMFTYIVEWLPESEQMEEAKKELAAIAKQRPGVLKVLQSLGLGK